jgi:hypothetical protein
MSSLHSAQFEKKPDTHDPKMIPVAAAAPPVHTAPKVPRTAAPPPFQAQEALVHLLSGEM